MSKRSTPKDDLEIREVTREQLGKDVRGKYFQAARDSSNIVVISSENAKAFPTSDAVNEALSKTAHRHKRDPLSRRRQ
jgi:hypothetical protein